MSNSNQFGFSVSFMAGMLAVLAGCGVMVGLGMIVVRWNFRPPEIGAFIAGGLVGTGISIAILTLFADRLP